MEYTPRPPARLARQRPAAPTASPARAWAEQAAELADWTLAWFANRLDAYGTYRSDAEVGREFTRPDDSKGRLGAQRTVEGRLTRALLVRHFLAPDRPSIIGLHSASALNLAKWGALDIDWHGPQSTAPAVNLRAALAWYSALAARGFRPLLTGSNGRGGFHLRVLLAGPIPADRLFRFLAYLTADHRQYGLPAPPEQFPNPTAVGVRKGPAIGDSGLA